MTDPPQDAPPSSGSLIGHTLKDTYRIERLIATGGMGIIYEAEQLRLRRKVAVKVLREHLARVETFVDLFRHEVEIVARLGHPHIVQVVDVDRTDAGVPFLVLEYLDGETLEQRLERESFLPVLEAVALTSQVASALAEMHASGTVHRDLKPANLFLVRAAGEPIFVKVFDFGVSVAPDDRHHLTAARAVVGTPGYMAPEQARGTAHGHLVDQFALAAIAYEALSGTQLFTGESVARILKNVLEKQPEPISHVAPWVPAAFDAVLSKALSKDPSQRYGTISQFAWALENASIEAGLGVRCARSTAPAMHAPSTSIPPAPVSSDENLTRPSVPVPNPGRRGEPSEEGTEPLRAHRVANAAATALLSQAEEYRRRGALDEAARCAERLLELAVYGGEAGTLQVVSSSMPVLDRIFRERVGPLDQVLMLGPAARHVRQLRLSPRAAAVLGVMDAPMTVLEILEATRMPEAEGIRLIAGLLARGALMEYSPEFEAERACWHSAPERRVAQ